MSPETSTSQEEIGKRRSPLALQVWTLPRKGCSSATSCCVGQGSSSCWLNALAFECRLFMKVPGSETPHRALQCSREDDGWGCRSLVSVQSRLIATTIAVMESSAPTNRACVQLDFVSGKSTAAQLRHGCELWLAPLMKIVAISSAAVVHAGLPGEINSSFSCLKKTGNALRAPIRQT